MAVQNLATRHAVVRESVGTSDGGGGLDTVMTPRGTIPFRIGTISGKMQRHYQRMGYEYVVTLQVPAILPKRINGKKKTRDLFRDNTKQMLVLVVDDRTMTPIGVRVPNDNFGPGPNGHINIDCIETPEAVGHPDLPAE